MSERKICAVGLGYVGLPLAVAFGKTQKVIGFDVNAERIKSLREYKDLTNETTSDELRQTQIDYTNDPARIAEADFIIIAVPTPVNEAKTPDLSALVSASRIVGKNMQKGSIVVYESTVYPGVTEDICVPILTEESGLEYGIDFKVGYSPERINPGDKTHTIDKVIKIVSGMDAECLDIIAGVYEQVVTAGVFRAENIKTAEAAKVIENIQRDLNIALMNELSIIFQRIGLDTNKVIEAAGTKWNFHQYHPGLVGGHCIGVDPYYLTYRALQLGIHPRVILAGRDINDNMSKYVAEMVLKELNNAGLVLKDTKVVLMGVTFKENVPDKRNSKAFDVIRHLREYSVNVVACEPILDEQVITSDKISVENVPFDKIDHCDCVVLVNGHEPFKSITLDDIREKMKYPVLIDIKSFYSRKEAEQKGITYRSL